MKLPSFFVLVLLGACSSSKEAPAPGPTPTPTTSAPAPTTSAPAPTTPAPAPGSSGKFAGACTVVVSGTVVCTEYPGEATVVQAACVKAGSTSIQTSFSPERCPTANLSGKCPMPGGTVNFYYAPSPIEAMKTACVNGGGTWTAP